MRNYALLFDIVNVQKWPAALRSARSCSPCCKVASISERRRWPFICLLCSSTNSVLILSKTSDTCSTLPTKSGWQVMADTSYRIATYLFASNGPMRNPMRRLGTTIAALSAANVWSLKRPSERGLMRAESGCLTHRQQSGLNPKQSD